MNEEINMFFVMLIAGIYDLVLLFVFFRRYRFQKKANRTKGIIVDYQFQGRYSHPIIEFTILTGKRIQVVGNMPRLGGKGKEVTVYYDSSIPAKISYSLGFVGFMLVFSFLVMGLILVLPIFT